MNENEDTTEITDPKQLAKFLFRVIKKNRLNNFGKLKIIDFYQEFMESATPLLSLIVGKLVES